MTLKNGTVIKGYWEDNKCVLPFTRIDGDEYASVTVLLKGKHEVEFESGQK